MFPTKFAIAIARKYSLYIPEEPKRISASHKNYKKGIEYHMCLEEFQKFALTSNLEDAYVAYIGLTKELTKKQEIGLGKIYKHTRIWVKGQVVEELLANISDDPKAMATIAALVLDVANGEEVDRDDEDATKLIIKLNHAK